MKRLFDIVFSALLLVTLSPLMVLIFLLILFESGSPAVFKQLRIGKNAKVFVLFKFRTMLTDIDAEKNFDCSKDDRRVTKLGKLLRRTKLDELPQLINVLKGDMSIVGPRPTLKPQVDNYNERQMRRLEVRPGITGLAQVSGGNTRTWDERIELDIHYIENMSMLLDLKIMLKTVLVVIFGEEAFKQN